MLSPYLYNSTTFQLKAKIARIKCVRIGIFDPYLDDLGGGEKYMMTIATCLSEENDVDVFWENQNDVDKLVQRFSLDTSRLKLVPNIFSSKVSFSKRFSESKKYDVIIILSDGSIPVISSRLFIHFQQPFPNIKRNFKNDLKKKKVNTFFVNSEFTKKFIDKEFGIDSKVIYPPVDLKPKEIKKENIILNVGRFRVRDVTIEKNGIKAPVGDYKKQSVMVKVFKEMVDSGFKDWKLIIATSVNERENDIFEEFKKQAEGYPIEFLVNKKNDDLWEIYSKAKIYWHASGYGEDLESHPEYAEHFGISTVEAMGAGAVPVVINAGGQKEIVTEGINGFLWNSLEELKNKTLRLVNDKQLLEKMSDKAKSRAQEFGGNRFEKQIKELLE